MRFIQHPSTGEIIPANEYVRPEKQRSELPSPMLVRDQMDELQHPHDGKTYSSKSEFRRVTKAGGGEEVGNALQSDNRMSEPVTKSDVGEAIRKVKEGYKPDLASDGKEGWS